MGPWATEGIELPGKGAARGRRLGDWVREMAGSCNDGDLVVVVSHGGTSGMLVRDLLQAAATRV